MSQCDRDFTHETKYLRAGGEEEEEEEEEKNVL